MNALSAERFLKLFPLLQKAPESLIREILITGSCEHFHTNAIILSEGQECNNLGLMLSGKNRIYKLSETGKEITLYEIGPGEFCILNASSILSNSPCPANADSITEVEMLLIPARVFRSLVVEYEEMRSFVFKLIHQIVATTLELVAEVAFRRMDERLMDYLVEKSENNSLFITHQKIANDLGTAREVISRLLKDFERKGILSLSRNLIQLNKM